jgi:Asp-tRNA(Asn)/Glu-tRNA(Gln) amidotransferase C subunit
VSRVNAFSCNRKNGYVEKERHVTVELKYVGERGVKEDNRRRMDVVRVQKKRKLALSSVPVFACDRIKAEKYVIHESDKVL